MSEKKGPQGDEQGAVNLLNLLKRMNCDLQLSVQLIGSKDDERYAQKKERVRQKAEQQLAVLTRLKDVLSECRR